MKGIPKSLASFAEERVPFSFLIAAISTILFLFVVVYYIRNSPFAKILVVDSEYYWELAVSIGHMGKPIPDFLYTAPLYTLFLALITKITGPDLIYAYLVNSIIAIMTILVLFELWQKLDGKRISFLSCVFVILYLPYAYYTIKILPEIFSIFLLSCFLLLYYMIRQESKLVFLIVYGIFGGLCILIRGQFLPIILILELDIFLRKVNHHSKFKRHLFRVLPLIITLLCLLPFCFYNLTKTKKFTFSVPNGGITFYTGNNQNSKGDYTTISGISDDIKTQIRDMQTYASRNSGRNLSIWEADNYFWRKGLDFIFSHPCKWLKLVFKKLLLLARPAETILIYDMELERKEFLPLLSVFFLNWGYLFPLAAISLISIFQDRNALSKLYPVLVSLLILAAFLLIFYVSDRYRLYLVPIVAFLAARGARDVIQWLRRKEYYKAIPSILLTISFIIFSYSSKPATGINSLYTLGFVYYRTKSYEKSEKIFKKIIEMDTNFNRAYPALIASLLLENKNEEAKFYMKRLANLPEYKEYYNQFDKHLKTLEK